MKILPFVSFVLLACSAASTDPYAFVVTEALFKDADVIYTAQHDIVKIYVPFNKFNFVTNYPHTFFFVEADINNGETIDQGLYVYKDRKATKIFNKGRDAVADSENVVYFGASDGIYKYNETDNTAVKYGNVSDNIIQMAHNNVTNTVYYLTASHEVYKLNADRTTSVKLSLKDIQALAFGYDGNMYYYDSGKNVYVFNDINEPKKVVGLPSFDKITLAAPMNGMEQGALLLLDKNVYVVKPNATITRKFTSAMTVTVDVNLTAFGPQPTLLQFYAKDKKLYQFNMPLVMQGILWLLRLSTE